MKYTLLIFLLFLLCAVARGQNWQFPNNNNCGTWEQLAPDTTDFMSVDTLGSQPIEKKRHWVYDEIKLKQTAITTLEYNPCGSGKPTIYYQYRICSITGIKQIRYITIRYKYTPEPKTEYEKVLQDFIEKNKANLPVNTYYLPKSAYAGSDTVFMSGTPGFIITKKQ